METLDRGPLDNLRNLIGTDGVSEIVALFTGGVPGQLAALEQACAAGDLKTAVRIAHTLKSSAAQIGAQRFSTIARDAEAHGDTRASFLPFIQALRTAYAELAPLLAPLAEAAPAVAPAAAAVACTPADGRPCLLIVEDNPDNRLLLRVLLQEHYVLKEFSDGDSALAALAQAAPDLALLDISLPGMDGEELLARIRAQERWRTLPAIAFTAHAMTGDREHFLQAGFDGYVAKPITDEQLLLATIASLLQRPRP